MKSKEHLRTSNENIRKMKERARTSMENTHTYTQDGEPHKKTKGSLRNSKEHLRTSVCFAQEHRIF